MKKIAFALVMVMALLSFKNATDYNPKDVIINSIQNEESEEFDWSKIPNSSAEIGGFPYISAPKDFIIWKDQRRVEVSKNGMTRFSDFSKLIMYYKDSFFDAEGKKAELDFAM